jgi:hypothetical protein
MKQSSKAMFLGLLFILVGAILAWSFSEASYSVFGIITPLDPVVSLLSSPSTPDRILHVVQIGEGFALAFILIGLLIALFGSFRRD